MTVTTENVRDVFAWTGAETVFACGFPADRKQDLIVILVKPDNSEVPLVLDVNFAASLASGTKIVSIVPIAFPSPAGTLVVTRRTPATVNEVLLDGQEFPASVHQELHDRAAMRSAEHNLKFDQSIIVAPEENGFLLPRVAERANRLLGFDADGKPKPAHFSEDQAEIAKEQVALAAQQVELAKEQVTLAAEIREETEQDAIATADDRAATNADREQTAADLAATQAARDAAQADADVYPTVSEGLAATIDGKQFVVPDGNRNVRYRRDSSTVAVQLTDYPTAAAVEPLQRTHGSIFAVEDADGNLGMDIQSPLRVSPEGDLETTGLQYFMRPGKWLWGLRDRDGNIPIGVDHLGRLVANFDLVPGRSASSPASAQIYDYGVNHVFCYGQSLSVGQAKPILSGTASYDTLMFARGMRPQYDYPSETAAQWYASLVPAIEALSSTQSLLGETPCRGTADMIKRLIGSEDGRSYTDQKYKLLLSSPGWGATTIAQLSKGTTHFARMVEQVGYGLSLANAQGDTYAVQAVTWIQGESDYLAGTTQTAYLAALNTLVGDIQTDLRAASGQTKRIAVIGYQVASHIHGASDDIPDIAMAQLACAETNPNFYIATPMYHFPYADGFHLMGVGSRWLGAYLGLAYKRIVIDGVEWSPLRPVSTVRQAKMVEMRFHVPHGELTLDTVGVPAQPHYGFQLVDAGGAPLTISSVEIVDRDRVRITAASAIPGGAKVRYAWQGNTAVGLGNLRDTQGDVIRFDPETSGLPMHNWCVIFERAV